MSSLKTINTEYAPPDSVFFHTYMNSQVLFKTGRLGIDPNTGDLVKGGVIEIEVICSRKC